MLGIDLLVRVGFALLLGLAIGVERQWRSRMAGMQSMALVSMGAALFVILGAYAFDERGNPTRSHFMVARLCHRLRRLSVPPNSVVKWVESMSTMSPAR
jgi:uncharacterized membrane protein YhiD involved in acid resistance